MRALPDNLLTCSALVVFNNGYSGSGFYISTKEYLYLASAKHVFLDSNGNLFDNNLVITSYSSDLEDTTPNKVSIDLDVLLRNNGQLIPHPTNDVILIKIGTVLQAGYNLFKGVLITSKASDGLVWTEENSFASFNKVLISNTAYIFGYPVSLGLKKSPQFNYEYPMLRRGIIAAKYITEGTIVLDCPAYGGNSGGPVIQVEKINIINTQYRIVGIVSQFIPKVDNGTTASKPLLHNSGYSVAVSMDKVLELLN